MSRMSVQDLVPVISKKHGITLKEAGAFVTTLFDVVNAGLKNERLVKIKGLGTFKIIDVRDRESVNVNTGERIVIDGRSKITFTPDAIMRDLVNRPFAQFETVVINDGVDIEEFDEVDRKAEALIDVGGRHADEASLENNTPAGNIQEDAATVPESVEEQEEKAEESTDTKYTDDEDAKAGPEYVPLAGMPEDLTDVAEDIADVTPSDTADDEKKPADAAETVGYAAEPAGEEYTSDGEDRPEAEEDEGKGRNGSLVRKIIILFPLFLLIAGVSAYVGFYFGWKSAVEYTAPVKTAEMTVEKVAKVPVNTKSDSTRTDTARLKHTEDTVTSGPVKTQETAPEKAEKPAAEAVKPKESEKKAPSSFSDKYDRENVMVRTGAYRIVGVERTVVLKKGQTLSSVSKSLFGPGMECYMEALNGVKEAKEGQSLKIPKLELRKKKKK